MNISPYICANKHTETMKTTSLKHYKILKAKGINVELVTLQDLNPIKK